MPASAVETNDSCVVRRRPRVGLAALGALILVGGVVLPATTSGAATAVGLGTAESFGVLGASAVTNTGTSVVGGDLGVYLGDPITGFDVPGGPGIVTPPGTIYENDAVAAQAQEDAEVAYLALAAPAQVCDVNLTGSDLGNLTLTPGVYCFDSSAQLTGALTLNAQGDPAAAFVFQIGSTLTTASASRVLFTNSFESCNVFWQVGSSATLGTTTDFVGTLIAHTSITADTDATVEGRLLALNGAVTLDSNDITPQDCSTAVEEPPVVVPPVVVPPVDEEPVVVPPVDEEPVVVPPVDETPVDETPVDEPAAEIPVAAPVDGTPIDGAEGAGSGGTPLAPAIPVGPVAAAPPVFVTGGPETPAVPGVTSGPGVPQLADTGSSMRLGGFGLMAIMAGSALVLLADPKRTRSRTRQGRA